MEDEQQMSCPYGICIGIACAHYDGDTEGCTLDEDYRSLSWKELNQGILERRYPVKWWFLKYQEEQ